MIFSKQEPATCMWTEIAIVISDLTVSVADAGPTSTAQHVDVDLYCKMPSERHVVSPYGQCINNLARRKFSSLIHPFPDIFAHFSK